MLSLGVAARDDLAPKAALAAVARHGVAGPVLNDYNFGGYLIFSGIAPAVDGRVDMYGEDFVKRYDDLGSLPALLDEYRIAWTLFHPTAPQVVLLDHLAGWRRLYAGDVAVVHVRAAAR